METYWDLTRFEPGHLVALWWFSERGWSKFKVHCTILSPTGTWHRGPDIVLSGLKSHGPRLGCAHLAALRRTWWDSAIRRTELQVNKHLEKYEPTANRSKRKLIQQVHDSGDEDFVTEPESGDSDVPPAPKVPPQPRPATRANQTALAAADKEARARNQDTTKAKK